MRKRSVKKKANLKDVIIGHGIFLLLGGCCGAVIMDYTAATGIIDKSFPLFMAIFLPLILFMILAMLAQIIIHEAGHLVFGLLTGYEFYSFRIGSFMLLKDLETGKLTMKKYSIAGTAGQCLMSPPEMKDGKIPYVLYNLGGVLMNLITGVIFFLLALITANPLAVMILKLMALCGVFFAISNGLPIKPSGIDNDGCNIRSISQSDFAMKAFWIQLKATTLMAQGVRVKDFPEEWFTAPPEDAPNNEIVRYMWALFCDRDMDTHQFEEALKSVNKYLAATGCAAGLQTTLIICNKIYCLLLLLNAGDELEQTREKVNILLTKEVANYMKMMKTFPMVLRTTYACALIHEKDEEKAGKIKETFEKVSLTHPFSAEVETETELMDIAYKKYIDLNL